MKNIISVLAKSLIAVAVLSGIFAGCTTQEAYIKPAKQVERDFYTCKEVDGVAFDKGGLPVEVTNEFMWSDGLLYVMAALEKDRVGSKLDFELTSPSGQITYTESTTYEEARPYGFYFDTFKMYERGGAGEWRVLFWANGEAMGRLTFNLEGPEGDRGVEAPSGQSIFEKIFGEEAAPIPEAAEVPEEATWEAVTSEEAEVEE